MIEKTALYHRAKSNLAYARDERTVHIRLRTKRDDANEVSLVAFIGSDWLPDEVSRWDWTKQEVPMALEFKTDLYDFWFVSLELPMYKMRYGFKVSDEDESLLYIERGFFDPDDPAIQFDIHNYFSFQYIHVQDVFRAPAWVKDTVWAQIYPERFFNGDPSNDPEVIGDWYDPQAPLGQFNFFGGDLRGVIEKLDYLDDLGINGLYLTPIFEGPSAHKYDTVDYFKIDSHFGTTEDLNELVEKAHARGMKVMLDAVFNHTSWDAPEFKDIQEKGEDSVYYDWYAFEGKNYHNFVPNMPKLDTTHPEVRARLLRVAEYWIEVADIDGWRLDVAGDINHQFWRDMRTAVDKIKPDFYINGEIWYDSKAWLHGDQFDGVMNYPLTKPIIEWVATENIDGRHFVEEFVNSLLRYSENVNLGMMSMVDSHDTPRITTLAGGNHAKVNLTFALLSLLPGSLMYYYGSEIYLEGGDDPENRRPMPWNYDGPRSNMQRMIQLRKDYPVLGSYGKFAIEYYNENTVVLTKANADRRVYCFFNTKGENQVPLLEPLRNQTVINIEDDSRIETDTVLTLKPYSYLFLIAEDE